MGATINTLWKFYTPFSDTIFRHAYVGTIWASSWKYSYIGFLMAINDLAINTLWVFLMEFDGI
jgi:hypothetical protein